MATSGGPNIINDGLVFGYDIGYPVADNTQALRFSKGEPTTNLVVNPDFSSGDLTGWSSTSTSNSQVDINGVSIENGYYYFHKKCTSTGAGSHDRLYQSSTYELDTSLKTTVTIDIWINPSNAYTLSFYGLGSTADDTTYNEKPLSSNSSVVTTIDLGGGWTRYIYTLQTGWYTGSGNAFRVAVYPGWSGTGLMEYKVKTLQVEQKNHASPFVSGTRSSTQSLIDLKKTTDIDLSNVSFDSNAQLTFDGTDDVIQLPTSLVDNLSTSELTVEAVVYHTSWGPANSSRPYIANWNTWNPTTPNQRGFILRTYTTSQYPSFWYCWGASYANITATTQMSLNQYYHIVGVFKKDNYAKIYVNGTEAGSTTSGTGNNLVYDDATGTRIGYCTINTGRLVGELPIIKLFNRALSANEIKQNYNSYKNRFGI